MGSPVTVRTIIAGVFIGVVGPAVASAQSGDKMTTPPLSTQKVTREFLLSHGFKESADDPNHFVRDQVRLGDVLSDMGLSLASLQPVPNGPFDEDMRRVRSEGAHFMFRAKAKNNKGRIIGSSQANPDAVYTVSVSINRPSPRVYLKTDSVPSLSIKSVTIPKAEGEWLHITLELAATGSKPLAIEQKDFKSSLTGSQLPGYSSYGVQFPKETPRIITVLPTKPVVLKISVPLNASAGVRLISGGEYTVQIRISPNKLPQSYDYQWHGEQYQSNDFTIVAKGEN